MSITLRVRQPLTPTARRGARIGGAVGFGLLSLGWAMVIVPLVVTLFAAAAALVLASITDSDTPTGQGTSDILTTLLRDGFGAPLIASVVLGVGIMVLSVFLSDIILRRHGVVRARAVTWAGIGISIVASWIVDTVLGLLGTFVASVASGPGEHFDLGYGIAIGAAAVIILLANAVIGWLVWWWMAHTLRPFSYA